MPYAFVTARQTLQGKQVANVLAFSNMQEDSAWLQDFADAFRVLANSFWDTHTTTAWTLDDILVSFVSGNEIVYSVPVSFTDGDLLGNSLGDTLPRGTALMARTSYVGAAPNRGRIYFTGFGEGSYTAGVWETGVRNDMRSLVQAWRDGITISGITASLQIARRPSAVFPTYVFNQVETVGTEEQARSQRNRNY